MKTLPNPHHRSGYHPGSLVTRVGLELRVPQDRAGLRHS